jgi:hypothetical protein
MADVDVTIKSRFDNKGLKQFQKEAKNVSNTTLKTLTKGFKTGALAGAALFAGAAAGAIAFGAKSVELAKEQIAVEAQLASVIASTGSAAGLTADQVKAMASELQNVTNFGDEATLTGQNMLLTFKNIGGDIFPRVTEAMLDMNVAMGQDMKTSAIQLGKALNDPIAGLGALSRVGVQFTEDQKAMVASMVEAGNVAGAQALILTELEGQFGGSARAAREADGGMIAPGRFSAGSAAVCDGICGRITKGFGAGYDQNWRRRLPDRSSFWHRQRQVFRHGFGFKDFGRRAEYNPRSPKTFGVSNSFGSKIVRGGRQSYPQF